MIALYHTLPRRSLIRPLYVLSSGYWEFIKFHIIRHDYRGLYEHEQNGLPCRHTTLVGGREKRRHCCLFGGSMLERLKYVWPAVLLLCATPRIIAQDGQVYNATRVFNLAGTVYSQSGSLLPVGFAFSPVSIIWSPWQFSAGMRMCTILNCNVWGTWY